MTEKKQTKCRYCGTPVTAPTYYGYTPVCDSTECNEEDRQAERERFEDAQERAREDGYERY